VPKGIYLIIKLDTEDVIGHRHAQDRAFERLDLVPQVTIGD
jgi:hypothetical protein